jgi:hypothetical protein
MASPTKGRTHTPDPQTMTHPLFRPHGSTQVEMTGSILTVHMRGHWNSEMREQTGQAMMRLVPTLNANGPWGIINLLHDTVVYGEEIYTQTRLGYAARPATSCLKAVAFVIGDGVEGAALMRPRFESLLQGVVESRVFADLASARTWMEEQLQAPS